MATTLEYDLRDTFDIERKLLLYTGFYPNEGRMNQGLYYLSRVYHIAVSLTIQISMAVFIWINIASLSTIAEVIVLYMTDSVFLFKLANLSLKKKKMLIEMENILADPVFHGLSDNDVQVIKDHVKVIRWVGTFFRVICLAAVVLYAIYPFLDKDENHILPLAGWSPLDVTNTASYWFTYTYQLLGYFLGATISSGIDLLNLNLIVVATALFEILKSNLNSIKYDSQEANNKFSEQVRLHYVILRFVSAIEEIFTVGVFLQILSSVLIICFTGFQMVVVPKTSTQFIHLFIYFNCMCVQVGMYCWFGHNIIESSDKINEAIYMSNWYESDIPLRKCIMIFMERCKQPESLTGAKLFPLSLATFTGIMRTSYSYFAILRRLCSPDE